jgi:hypothetical protein
VPACALALLTIDAVRGRESSAAARAYLAVAVSLVLWVVVEVGVFASHYAAGIVERDLLGLAPLLFLGLGLWLDRGAPRPYLPAAAIAFCAGALLLALPYDRFVAIGGIQDSMTFAAALQLPDVDPFLLVGAPAVALAALFAVLPRRAAPALAAVLVVAFAAGSAAASHAAHTIAAERVPVLLGPDPRWIDRAADGPVGFVFAGGSFYTTVWTNAFWNRRVASVYDLPDAHVDGPIPQRRIALGGDGRFPSTDRYLVLPSYVTAAGTRVATATLVGSDVPELTLWRLDDPPRLYELRTGFKPNGDVPSEARVREFGCARGGTFLVTLLGKTDQTVKLFVGQQLASTVRLAREGEAKTATVHVPPGGGAECRLTIRPSSLVGTTQILFARG